MPPRGCRRAKSSSPLSDHGTESGFVGKRLDSSAALRMTVTALRMTVTSLRMTVAALRMTVTSPRMTVAALRMTVTSPRMTIAAIQSDNSEDAVTCLAPGIPALNGST